MSQSPHAACTAAAGSSTAGTAASTNASAMIRFYSRCPYHKRRCKCSFRSKTTNAPAKPEVIITLPTIVSGTIPFSASDRRMLKYLRDCGNVELSGYVPHADFWEQLLPQACQSEPAVRRASLALAAAHLDHVQSRGVSRAALEAYSKALVQLQDYCMENVQLSSTVIIICCIVLCAFDRVRQDERSAQVHLNAGLSIRSGIDYRKENKSSKSLGLSCIPDEATLTLLAMDTEVTISDPSVLPRLQLGRLGIGTAYWEPGWSTRMSFPHPQDLMRPWMIITHDLWRFIAEHAAYRWVEPSKAPQDVVQTRQFILSQCEEWISTVYAWKQRNPEPNIDDISSASSAHLEPLVRDYINILTLQGHHITVTCALLECLRETSDHFHCWDLCADELLELGRQVLTYRKLHRELRHIQHKKTFSVHVGLVECIIALAHRTRDPEIRKRAVQTIKNYEELQGLSGLSDAMVKTSSDWILWFQEPGLVEE